MLNENTLSNQIMMAPQPYKRGGKVSRKMIAAHMAPHELDILDHLQGGKEIDLKSGARAYSHFEHLLGNPHLRVCIMQAAKKKFAEGGAVEHISRVHEDISEDPEKDKLQRLLDLILAKKAMKPEELTREEMEFLAANGEHGDREMALLGPRTHHAFDQLAGHRTKNPKTGLPEYFELSSVLSGLWDVLKGAGGHLAGGLAEGLAHSGARYLEDKTGHHPLAHMAGQFARGASRYLGDKFRGAGASSPYARRMGGIGSRMVDDPEAAYEDARDMAGGLGAKFAGMGRRFARYGMGRAQDFMQQGMDTAGRYAEDQLGGLGRKFQQWQRPQRGGYQTPAGGEGFMPLARVGHRSFAPVPGQRPLALENGSGPLALENGPSESRALALPARSGMPAPQPRSVQVPQGMRFHGPVRNTFAENHMQRYVPGRRAPAVMPAIMPAEEEQEQAMAPVNF